MNLRAKLEDPQPNEVLVKIKACGGGLSTQKAQTRTSLTFPPPLAVCHTDLAVQKGLFPSPFPTIVGHEGSGEVVQVGSAVTRVVPGDSVLLTFNYCGECASCHVRICQAMRSHTDVIHRRTTPLLASLMELSTSVGRGMQAWATSRERWGWTARIS